MKKIVFITIGIVLLIVISVLAFQKPSTPSAQEQGLVEAGAEDSSIQIVDRDPAGISVGIVDTAPEATSATKLLEQRLKAIGFTVSIMQNHPNAAQAGSDLMTVLYAPGEASAVDVLQRTAAMTGVIRRFEYGAKDPTLVIAAWSLDDILWGDQSAEAQKLMDIDPGSVGVTVLNSGAASGEAGRIADVLKTKGYALAEGVTGDSELIGDSIVYYQRNFRSTAKKIVSMLRENGFPNVTYRARQNQDVPIVIELMGQEGAATETPTE